jgi:hypothetical protein
VSAPRAEEEVAATAAAPAAGDVEMLKEKKEDGTEGAAPAKGAAAAKGDAKAAPAGDKKAEAKPEAKAGEKKK